MYVDLLRNLIIIFYNNPFKNKTTFIRNIIPEVGILGAIVTTIIFAIDDQVRTLII